jgi:selenocysteine-specific elongation factor
VVISKCAIWWIPPARRKPSACHPPACRTALAGAPLFHVSSHNGAGIATAPASAATPVAAIPPPGQRFRLAIDRAFSLSGAGLVVTGTALGGQVAVGDRLWLSGRDTPVRVRSLHVQNTAAESGQAGQRIAH